MNILNLAWKNIVAKPLNTFLSVLLLALGVGMISLVTMAHRQIAGQIEKNVSIADMVVGAKGSPLQLILASLLHIDNPTGNISLEEAQNLRKHRMVASAIPLSYGDSYRGYRIVGTTKEFLSVYHSSMDRGEPWKRKMQAVLGAQVARKLQLDIGDEFLSAHGLVEEGEQHDHHPFIVVGILTPAGNVLDQLILTNLESIWEVHEYREEAQSDPQITAMLIKFRGPMGLIQLPRMINEDTNMQAAVPSFEVNRLMGILGVGVDFLMVLGIMLIVVSGISLFIPLYNALKERRYEMGLLRSYGATRNQLVVLLLVESLGISLLGFLLGSILSRVGIWAVSNLMEDHYRYSMGIDFHLLTEGWIFIGTLGIGLLAAVLPVIQVYRLDVSKTLTEG